MSRKGRRFIGLALGLPVVFIILSKIGLPAVVPKDLSRRTSFIEQEIPPPAELERRLFEILNRERASLDLPVLHLNPALCELAGKHSAEMAGLGRLSHISETGRSYSERLQNAGIFYTVNGENVARSDSFDQEFIHKALMKSESHRKAILNPEFDEVGIGIALGSDGVYSVTQDFIKGVTPAGEGAIRTLVIQALEETARRKGLPPPLAADDVHVLARTFAREKIAGRDLPAIPPVYGAASVHFFMGADLDSLLEKIMKVKIQGFRIAGIGSTFERTPAHPGGAFCICLFLIQGSPDLDLGDKERMLAVLEALNEIRISRGGRTFMLDEGLSRKAEEYNLFYLHQAGGVRLSRNIHWVVLYETTNLSLIPVEVRERIKGRFSRRIGVSVRPTRTVGFLPVAFSVAVLLR